MSAKAVLITVLTLSTLTVAAFTTELDHVISDRAEAFETSLKVQSETSQIISLELNSGAFQVQTTDDGISYAIQSENQVTDIDGRPSISGLIALPWGSEAELVISGGHAARYTMMGGLAEEVDLSDAPMIEWASLGKPGILTS